MARFDSLKGTKIEKVCSKDSTRPVLAAPAIVEWEGGLALAATDSYKLAVLPLEGVAADGLEVGPIDLGAVREAVKSGYAEITSAGGSTVLETPDGSRTARNAEGQFPDPARLFPTDRTEWEIGVNAKFLYELAQALGSDVVAISFVPADGPDGRPNVLRPMLVRPNEGPARGARGIIMPIRVAPAS